MKKQFFGKLLDAKLIFGCLTIIAMILVYGCQQVAEPVNNLSSANNSSVIQQTIQKAQVEDMLVDMKKMAKGLAILLKNEEYRKILESNKNLANNREEILDACIFLNEIITINENGKVKETSLLDELISRNKDINGKYFKETYKSLKRGILDIYFPVDEHRAKWNSNSTDLLVAAVDQREAEKKDGIVPAYDCNGNEVILNTQKAPKLPVLVIAFSETHGKYPPKVNHANNSLLTKSNTKKDSIIINALPPGVSNDLKIYHLFCRDPYNWDGWLMGDPEFYVEAYENSYTYTRTDFFDVTEETDYYLDRQIYHRVGSVAKIWIKWKEDDGGLNGGDELVEDRWTNSDYNHNGAYYCDFYSFSIVTYWGTNDDIYQDVYWYVE